MRDGDMFTLRPLGRGGQAFVMEICSHSGHWAGVLHTHWPAQDTGLSWRLSAFPTLWNKGLSNSY